MNDASVWTYIGYGMVGLFGLGGIATLIWAMWPTWRSNKQRWDKEREEDKKNG